MRLKIIPKFDFRFIRRNSFQLSLITFVVTVFVLINRKEHTRYRKRNEIEIAIATVVQKNGRTFSNMSTRNVPEVVQTTYHENLTMYSHFFIPSWEVVTPLDFKFKAATRAGCGHDHPFLVFVILSMTRNRKLRDAVRNTWGSVSRTNSWAGGTTLEKRVMVIFVIGTSSDDSALEQEAHETGDIIHVTVEETYFNLTYKVLMGFLWLEYYCKRVQFIAKIDEDTFPDVPVFVETLSSVDMSYTVMGPCFTRGKVERTGKYGVDVNNYPPNVYPPHCKGNFYLMPAGLAFRVLATARHIPYVNMEDAHLSGIVPAVVGGVRFRGFTEAQYHLHTSPEMCEYVSGTIIVGQKVDPPLANEIWRRFHDNSLCINSK